MMDDAFLVRLMETVVRLGELVNLKISGLLQVSSKQRQANNISACPIKMPTVWCGLLCYGYIATWYLWYLFIHTLQGYFTDSGAITWHWVIVPFPV